MQKVKIIHDFCITFDRLVQRLKNYLVSFFDSGSKMIFCKWIWQKKTPHFAFMRSVNQGDTMDSNTRMAKSYVSHEEVQSAMEQYLARGGKISKVEDPCQEILLKRDMGEESMDNIDPHAANPSSNGLGDIGGILQQKMQSEQKEA